MVFIGYWLLVNDCELIAEALLDDVQIFIEKLLRFLGEVVGLGFIHDPNKVKVSDSVYYNSLGYVRGQLKKVLVGDGCLFSHGIYMYDIRIAIRVTIAPPKAQARVIKAASYTRLPPCTRLSMSFFMVFVYWLLVCLKLN
tara:strand:+ start:575 stop:994 length:420 start_codon:yes stop_codon:yes gene_type:complete